MSVAIVIVTVGLFGAFGCAARRAANDWPFQLRLIRTLSVLAARDACAGPFDLWEVELVGTRPCAGSLSVTISAVDRPRGVAVFELEVPLAEMAERCASWRDAGTPLLFSGDALGDAVVYGPGGCLVGRMAAPSDPELAEWSPRW